MQTDKSGSSLLCLGKSEFVTIKNRSDLLDDLVRDVLPVVASESVQEFLGLIQELLLCSFEISTRVTRLLSDGLLLGN